jgi:hypothetical protein
VTTGAAAVWTLIRLSPEDDVYLEVMKDPTCKYHTRYFQKKEETKIYTHYLQQTARTKVKACNTWCISKNFRDSTGIYFTGLDIKVHGTNLSPN